MHFVGVPYFAEISEIFPRFGEMHGTWNTKKKGDEVDSKDIRILYNRNTQKNVDLIPLHLTFDNS